MTDVAHARGSGFPKLSPARPDSKRSPCRRNQSGCALPTGEVGAAHSISTHSPNFMPSRRASAATVSRPLGSRSRFTSQFPTLWLQSVFAPPPYQPASTVNSSQPTSAATRGVEELLLVEAGLGGVPRVVLDRRPAGAEVAQQFRSDESRDRLGAVVPVAGELRDQRAGSGRPFTLSNGLRPEGDVSRAGPSRRPAAAPPRTSCRSRRGAPSRPAPSSRSRPPATA